MKKKLELVIIIIFTVGIIIFSLYFGIYSKTRYENVIVTEDVWQDIISSRNHMDNPIKDLKFNDNILFRDNKNTYYYSLVENDSNSYMPTIKYHSSKRVNIAIKEYITDDLIENNKPLELLIYSDDGYNIINIICTTLPIMNISYNPISIEINVKEEIDILKFSNITNESLSDKLNNVRNYKDKITYDVKNMDLNYDVDMSITLFDNRTSISNRVIKSDGLFRYRGASTLFYPKKGYRINLRDEKDTNHISLLGMREDDDYMLYAAYNDAEKIRNVFSSKLWYDCCSMDNSYNLINGMEYKYVELFINNSYRGLYALGYPIDNKTMDLDTFNEYMFKKYNWDASENLSSKVDMTGYELVGDTSSSGFNYLNSYYKTILSLSKKNVSNIYNQIDIDNAIDIFLFYNFVQGVDNVSSNSIKNTYITFKNDGESMKAIYTPWDLDFTFGNRYTEENNILTASYVLAPSYNVIMKLNPIYSLISLNDKDIKKRVYERYRYLRENTWSDYNISKLIDMYEDDIYNSGAYLREMERWPDGNYINSSIKLSKFKNYVIERLEYTDLYMERYK